MEGDILGATFALMAALSWAFAMVLFKQSGDRVPPLALNLFKNTVAIILLLLTLACLGNGFSDLEAYSARDIWILVLSGFLGVTVADTMFFYSLNLIGVGLTSIVDCLYSPLVVILSVLILHEQLTRMQYLGAALILVAVFITSRHKPPVGKTRGQLIFGIFLGAMCMVTMAFGIVIAKDVWERTPLITSTTIRIVSATATLAIIVLFMPQRRALFSAFKPSIAWKTSIPGSVLGAYLALVFWTGGFKYTNASLAGILNQTSSILAMILATLILKEAFTRRKLVAIILAMSGIILVLVEQAET